MEPEEDLQLNFDWNLCIICQETTNECLQCPAPGGGGGGLLRFAVIRRCADFQGRLFDPKYFRQGANLGFN